MPRIPPIVPRNAYGDVITRVPKLPTSGIYAYSDIIFATLNRYLSCTFYWQRSAAPGAGYNSDTFASAIMSHWNPIWPVVLSNQVSLFACLVHVHDGALEFSGSNYGTAAGAISAPPLPDEVAVVVSRVSAIAGKSGRGRVYIRGIANTLITGDRLNATGITAFNTFVGGLNTTVSDGTITWTPAHFVRKPISPATVGAMEPVSYWKLNAVVGTSRRSRSRF